MSLDVARRVADAVLFEGYVLYPYRASSQKNQIRWQFGVLVPRAVSEAGSEPWHSQTECLLEGAEAGEIAFRVRFLHVQAKTVERSVGDHFEPVPTLTVGDEQFVTWDEGVDVEVDRSLEVSALRAGDEQRFDFSVPGSREVELIRDRAGDVVGRAVRERWPVEGTLRVAAERFEGPYGLMKLRVLTENASGWQDLQAGREQALRRSLVAAHTLMATTQGAFVSLLEPPEWARPAAQSCENLRTWPVLVGEDGQRDAMLSSPIILYDYPEIAPESAGDLFDATEIDEILTLRTMTLTDDEKREARGTDQRAAAVIDRVDSMPQEMLDRLHGAIRYLREVTGEADEQPDPSAVPWWDPGSDASVSPETDGVQIGGETVSRGSRVRLHPLRSRADAQDMFLEGRVGMVEAVFFDVDDNRHLAVTLEDDPAADLARWHGRYLYFSPDEVEPLGSGQSSEVAS